MYIVWFFFVRLWCGKIFCLWFGYSIPLVDSFFLFFYYKLFSNYFYYDVFNIFILPSSSFLPIEKREQAIGCLIQERAKKARKISKETLLNSLYYGTTSKNEGLHCWPVYAPCRAVNRHSTHTHTHTQLLASLSFSSIAHSGLLLSYHNVYIYIYTRRSREERGPGTFGFLPSLLIFFFLFLLYLSFSLFHGTVSLTISFTHIDRQTHTHSFSFRLFSSAIRPPSGATRSFAFISQAWCRKGARSGSRPTGGKKEIISDSSRLFYSRHTKAVCLCALSTRGLNTEPVKRFSERIRVE